MIKFCAKSGCRGVAIGVARWDKDVPAEKDHCRKHFLSEVLTETVTCEVVGSNLITDVRTQEGVGKGGQVELDPLEVNIAQLVYAGHVQLLEDPPKGKAAAAAKKD